MPYQHHRSMLSIPHMFNLKLLLFFTIVINLCKCNEIDTEEVFSQIIGCFTIRWKQKLPYFEIEGVSKFDRKSKVLFRSLDNWSFLTVGYAASFRQGGPIVDGNYKPDEWTLFETSNQNILNTEVIKSENEHKFIIRGEVWGWVTLASYEISFNIPRDDNTGESIPNQLEMNIQITPINGKINKLFLNYWCDPDEKFYGFGTQFTHYNMKGHRIPIIVSEQGIGRGAQPTTFLLNTFGDGVGGNSKSTYAPKPLYLTNFLRSLVFLNSDIIVFDLRDDDSVVVETSGFSLHARIINADSVPDIIEEITKITGRMKPLPEWTQEGAIVGLEGGTREVDQIANLLMKPIYKLPLVGVWLQDWSGLRNAYDGDRLVWNWRLNKEYYPNWNQLVRSWADVGVRVLTYVNPFFSADPKHTKNHEAFFQAPSGIVSNNSRNPVVTQYQASPRDIFIEGLVNRYFLYSEHDSTYPYVLRSGSIEFHMLDLTNPYARRWMKDILKYEMIQNSLSSGWMADFAEYAPFDIAPFDRRDYTNTDGVFQGAQHHNQYPQLWAQLNYEAVKEAKEEGIFESVGYHVKRSTYVAACEYCKLQDRVSDTVSSNEWLYFMRSAWLESPKYTSSFWLGDQMVSWDQHDGIKSSLVGLLSSGLSGHSLTHSDIGGYTMQERGPYPYIRTKELLFRWIELAAFSASVFRTHVGSSCNPLNQQIYDDDESIHFFSKFATIFSALRCYRHDLMMEAELKGYPLVRPMTFHFIKPNVEFDDFSKDPIWDLTNQFMFGSDFLVAPVLDPVDPESILPYSKPYDTKHINTKKISQVKVYIPHTVTWVHLWTGYEVDTANEDTNHQKHQLGRFLTVSAPIGFPVVFYRKDSFHGRMLREFIISKGWEADSTDSAKITFEWDEMKLTTKDKDSTLEWLTWLGLLPTSFATPSPTITNEPTIKRQDIIENGNDYDVGSTIVEAHRLSYEAELIVNFGRKSTDAISAIGLASGSVDINDGNK